MNSMTGYGRCDLERDKRSICLELKSVNHRFLDLSFRMPRTFSYLEDSLRALLGKRLARGHVDIFINYRNLREDSKKVSVDQGLVKGYLDALQQVKAISGLRDDVNLSFIARMPDVLVIDEEAEDLDALRALTMDAANAAIDQLLDMRLREGERMEEDIRGRLDAMDAYIAVVKERSPIVTEEYRTKLTQRVTDLMGDAVPDMARITQEVALFTDKIAVDEEVSRLLSHIKALKDAMELKEPVGRKLDFIVQEMNREANTIGSKASDTKLVACVVNLKTEIEKIREQVQNIE